MAVLMPSKISRSHLFKPYELFIQVHMWNTWPLGAPIKQAPS